MIVISSYSFIEKITNSIIYKPGRLTYFFLIPFLISAGQLLPRNLEEIKIVSEKSHLQLQATTKTR